MDGIDIKKALPIIAAVVVAVLAIGLYLVFGAFGTKAPAEDAPEVFVGAPEVDPRVHRDETPEGVRVEDTALFVPDQTSTTQVFLDEVDLPENGFVVVRMYQEDGQGRVLGYSSMLAAGLYKNIALGLDSKVLMGTPLLAVLYVDTNENGVFEEDSDIEMTDLNGSVIETFFTVKISE